MFEKNVVRMHTGRGNLRSSHPYEINIAFGLYVWTTIGLIASRSNCPCHQHFKLMFKSAYYHSRS